MPKRSVRVIAISVIALVCLTISPTTAKAPIGMATYTPPTALLEPPKLPGKVTVTESVSNPLTGVLEASTPHIGNVPTSTPTPTPEPEPEIVESPKPSPTPKPLAKTSVKDSTYDVEYETYTITAYTSGDGYTPVGQQTASGTDPVEGRTIAAPKNIPFGTKIYIPELGKTYICEDRGGRITGKKLDIYFDSIEDANAFGKRKLLVKIIK